MKVAWLHTGADGKSHFKDLLVPVEKDRESMRSALFAGTGAAFAEASGGGPADFHNAPRRQWVVVLTGHMEVDIGDGVVRRFGPGEIFLAGDLTGRGHAIRPQETPRSIMTVPLSADVDVSRWEPA